MQGGKLNVILFEDSETERGADRNSGLASTLAELSHLNQRILRIQTEERSMREKLQGYLQQRELEPEKPNSEQQRRNMEEILMFLERKLQVLTAESSQAIEEIKEEVERLLTREMLSRKMKKFQGKEDAGRIERIYQQKMQMLSDSYRSELEAVQRKNSDIQKVFEQRLAQLQLRALNKARELEANEKHLKESVRLLEQQLRAANDAIAKQRMRNEEAKRAYQVVPPVKIPTFLSLPEGQPSNLKSGRENAIDDPAEKESVSRIRRNKIFDRDRRQRRNNNQQQSISPIRTVDYSDLASMKMLNHDLDRFEDFKEHDMDGSDQDVFFYPEAARDCPAPMAQPQQAPLVTQAVVSSFKLQSGPTTQVVFSPFDIK